MVSCCGQPLFKRSATSSVRESHSPLEITLHKAGVVRDGLMSAAVALLAMTTERSRTAAHDGIEHLDLMPGQGTPVTIQKSTAAAMNDIGHLPGWSCHC